MSEYIDIREIHSNFEHRECTHCGAEWYKPNDSLRGGFCPFCQQVPIYEEYAEIYVEKVLDFKGGWPSEIDDYYAIIDGMAADIDPLVDHDVNPFHCLDFIREALPEDHPKHNERDPLSSRIKPHHDEIIVEGSLSGDINAN